jgi:hypothetical protein
METLSLAFLIIKKTQKSIMLDEARWVDRVPRSFPPRLAPAEVPQAISNPVQAGGVPDLLALDPDALLAAFAADLAADAAAERTAPPPASALLVPPPPAAPPSQAIHADDDDDDCSSAGEPSDAEDDDLVEITTGPLTGPAGPPPGSANIGEVEDHGDQEDDASPAGAPSRVVLRRLDIRTRRQTEETVAVAAAPAEVAGDAVLPFALDGDFDYDNIHLTARPL